jgi:hypothetical protein
VVHSLVNDQIFDIGLIVPIDDKNMIAVGGVFIVLFPSALSPTRTLATNMCRSPVEALARVKP